MHRVITIIIFSLIAVAAYPQRTGGQWNITGSVLDAQTGETVPYANVLLYSAGDSALAAYTATTAAGDFTLKHGKAGEYYLIVGSIGFVQKRVPLQLLETQRDIALGAVQLQPAEVALSEVEVVGQQRQVVYKLDRRVIEASGFLSAAGGTAVDILAQTPSISVDAEGEVSFRGSTGFKVYIDGKPATQEGTAALEQVPAGQIDNIEVITTPSARNDADGAAGIININTKKQTVDGWSGMVNLMGSTAQSRNVDFLLAHRKKDVLWQVAGEASRRYLNSDFDQVKTIHRPEQITEDHSFGTRTRYTDVYSLRTGIDLYKNNTTWTASVEAGYRSRWRGGELDYEDKYYNRLTEDTTFASFTGDDYVNLTEWNLRGDAGFNHRFAKDGHRLTGALYALYQGNAMEYFETNLYNTDGSQAQGHKAWELEYRFTAQANLDYVLPLAKPDSKFEAGYQYFSYTEDGDYDIDLFNPELNKFEHRGDLYNRYLFRRDIHALYSMVSSNISRFSYQLGLRGEYTYRKLGNNIEEARHTWHRFGLFPSVHLAFELEKNARTNLAYSRRITQPQLFYMEPYVVYVDYYTAQHGNPHIQPEYTNSVEWNYNKSFGNNSFTGGLFFRARKDKIERVRVPYLAEVTLDSMANVGNDYASGVELQTTLQLRKWWNLDANGSLYYYKIRNEWKIDGNDENSMNWQLAINNNFDLTKSTRMRLEAYYVGPSVSTQGRVEEFFYMNLTVRQQLFNRRLTASLSVRDLLATARYNSVQNNINVMSVTQIIPQAPVAMLTLSYTFNNFRQQRKEESATHDLFEGTNR